MSNDTLGQRHDYTAWDIPQSGEYGKLPNNEWYAFPPNTSMHGNISNHSITVHTDGTISVSPSILVTYGDGISWHGYLTNGIWHQI